MSDDDRGRAPRDGISAATEPATRHPDVTDSLDDVFGALADARRRYVLYVLSSAEADVVERPALVDAVVAYEGAAAGTTPPSEDAVRADLHHRQLPHLAEAGFVQYDRRQGTVRAELTPALAEWVDHARYRELDVDG